MRKKCTFINSLFLKFHLIIITVCFAAPFVASGQSSETIHGKITNESGEVLEGAVVKIKGSANAAQTNANGLYEIKLTQLKGAILVITHVGYKRKEVAVDGRRMINVQMESDSKSLDEIVVIGYGQVNKKDLTGAVSSIKPREEDAVQVNSVDALIRGRAAGVQVTQSNGSPGGALSVKIRGLNSLRGNNEPLYVVDGIIITNSSLDTKDVFPSGQNASNQESQNGLSGINPQDIESIEILKDASATAIYGSRGANGVVIITTKQGQQGGPKIGAAINTEFAKVSKRINVLDGPDYVQYRNELAKVNNSPDVYSPDTLQYINWQDDLQQTAIRQNYRLTLSGATDNSKTNYYVAGGYMNAKGVIKNSGFNVADFKINFGQKISNKLNFNARVAADFRTNNATNGTERLGLGNNSVIGQMITAIPILNVLPEIGDDIDDAPNNPRVWIEDYDDISKEKRILANTDLTYKISNAFSYKLSFSNDYRNKERVKWQGKSTLPGQKQNGALGLSQLERNYYSVENLLFFRKKIKKDRIDATLGVTYDNELITSSSVLNTNFFTGALGAEGFGFGEILYPYERDKSLAEVFSVLGRLNYSLSEKLILTLSGRADGSSKFSKANKFGFFPSFAVAYRLINEEFMKSSSLFSDFKIRAGYGQSGNQGIDPYATFSRYGKVRYSDDGNAVTIGTAQSNIANPDLKWETTEQYNGGLDLAFFNNRLTATVDVYYKKTRDLLQTLNLPQSTGFSTIVINRGTLENKGLEVSVAGKLIEGKQLNWSVNANIAFNRNKLLNLGLPMGKFGTMNATGYIGGGISTSPYFKDPVNIFLEGRPIGLFYGYKTNGVYQTAAEAEGNKGVNGLPAQPGDLRFVDMDGDKLITENDKIILGDPNPSFTYGFNTSVSYKRFGLDVFMNGVYGNDIVNGNSIRWNSLFGATNVLADAYHTAWRPASPSSNPRVGFDNLNFIDRYVENGSFLRLTSVILRYGLPLSKSSFIKAIDFTLTGSNLFVITNYSGFDPEVNSFTFDSNRIGVDWNAYPRTKGIALGFNLKF